MHMLDHLVQIRTEGAQGKPVVFRPDAVLVHLV